MRYTRLTPTSGSRSGSVIVPKDWLRNDGLTDSEGSVEGAEVKWVREGEGEYRAIVLDDDGRPLTDGGVSEE